MPRCATRDRQGRSPWPRSSCRIPHSPSPRASSATITHWRRGWRQATAQSETRWPQIDLRIDGAAALIEEKLEQALAVDAPIEVTFREYVRDDAMEGPARVISGLELDKTDTDDLSVRGTAGFAGLDARFGLTYDPAEYPGVR